MKYVLSLLVLAFGSYSFGSQTEPPVSWRKPNIVFILADDLGWGDVGFHNSQIETPHIDFLAKSGVRLSQHYVSPMCTPTRVSLLTGCYPSRFGDRAIKPSNIQVMPFDTVTLASALKSVGYKTAISGKWHLGCAQECGPLKFGFDNSYGTLAGGVGPYTHLYKKGAFSATWHRNDILIEEEGHTTDLIAREAVRDIINAKNAPLFLYLAFTAVHVPVVAPQKWVDYYKEKIQDESYRHYAAYTSHMDEGIGKVIDALRHTGKFKNTVFVFTSDNGSFPKWAPRGKYPGKYRSMERLGSNLPYRGYKAQLYEGGIRSPTAVYWPGVIEGNRRIDTAVDIVDWMPTLCSIAGYTPKKDLRWDGRNILPLLKGEEATSASRTFYWKFINGEKALRSGDWKLIIQKGRSELYNIASDPYEKKDVAVQFPERVKELKALLSKAALRDGDVEVQ